MAKIASGGFACSWSVESLDFVTSPYPAFVHNGQPYKKTGVILGRGGNGTVYEVKTKNGMTAALKIQDFISEEEVQQVVQSLVQAAAMQCPVALFAAVRLDNSILTLMPELVPLVGLRFENIAEERPIASMAMHWIISTSACLEASKIVITDFKLDNCAQENCPDGSTRFSIIDIDSVNSPLNVSSFPVLNSMRNLPQELYLEIGELQTQYACAITLLEIMDRRRARAFYWSHVAPLHRRQKILRQFSQAKAVAYSLGRNPMLLSEVPQHPSPGVEIFEIPEAVTAIFARLAHYLSELLQYKSRVLLLQVDGVNKIIQLDTLIDRRFKHF